MRSVKELRQGGSKAGESSEEDKFSDSHGSYHAKQGDDENRSSKGVVTAAKNAYIAKERN